MDNYRTASTSKYSARLLDPVVIEETKNTRKVLVVDLNDKKLAENETVGITIVHQRKNFKEGWEDIESIRLSSLKGGEGVRLNLDSKTTRRLYEELTKLYTLVKEKGVSFGINEFTIAKADEIIRVPKDRILIIERLLEENAEEIWKELERKDPDLATRFSLAKIQTDRSKALQEFKKNIDNNNSDESYWQRFFSTNEWIFGYGLNYQFLNLLTDQPDYGGSNFTGKGKQRGDYLANTVASVKFTVLVEIKTPATNLLSYDKKGNGREIRNDTWLLSSDLLGAVSQIQVNSKTWNWKSQDKENIKILEAKNIFTVEPKGILVIGNTAEFKNNESILNCFEVFRRNLHNPEVITFDELYERANFIVNNQKKSMTVNVSEDDYDLPF